MPIMLSRPLQSDNWLEVGEKSQVTYRKEFTETQDLTTSFKLKGNSRVILRKMKVDN